MSKWQDRIIGQGKENPEQLLANPQNWRIHPKHQQEALKGALEQIGWIQQVIVNQRTGHLVDGHLRVELSMQEGETEVPVVYVDLSEDEEKLALATIDPLSAMADTDQGMLDRLLEGIDTDSEGLNLLLDSLASKDLLDEEEDGQTDDDACPDTDSNPVSCPGDLWILGTHRLMCGSSTDPEAVKQLMDGSKARLCFTSPPYGSQRDYKSGGISNWDKLMNGVFSNDTLGQATTKNAQVLVNLGLIHHKNEWQPYWHDWLAFMQTAGWRRFGLYVWDQGPGMPGDWAGRFAPAFELVFHFNRQKRKPNKIVPCEGAGEVSHRTDKNGMRNTEGEVGGWTQAGAATQDYKIPDSVIRIMRQKGSIGDGIDHPAVFPIALPEHFIEAFTDEGELCYETFGGSGTSIIAAQNTGRRMYAMELAPEYCDVVLERFRRKFPDTDITHQQTGKNLPDITAEQWLQEYSKNGS